LRGTNPTEPSIIDKDITIILNGLVSKGHLLNAINPQSFGNTSILNALIPVAIITGLWFSSESKASRCRLLAGVCAVLAATALSRTLQMSIAIHQRPALEMPLNLPTGFEFLSRLSSFPSDHATLVLGLSTVIFLRNKWLGLVSFAWTMLICADRLAFGLHYPSDILGGLVLGAAAAALSRWIRCPEWIWRFKELHRGLFYGLMMIGAYETITFFNDILMVVGVFQ
jgi:undecaprenyl-diphosphatase